MNLSYTGKVGQLYKIWISNLFLQIITLFIYRPWAKTKTRKYLFSNISIFGDRMEYSGTGGELFKGFITAALILILIPLMVYMLVGIALPYSRFYILLDSAITKAVFWILFLWLLVYSKFSSLRYRLSHLRWRSIRAKIEGSGTRYVLFRLKRALMSFISFGFLMGRSDLLAKKYLIERMSIGSVKFSFEGDYKALDKANFISLLLALPTFMLSRIWYVTKLRNYVWSSVKIGDNIKMSASFGFRKHLWLILVNLVIIVFTLGLGFPICLQRTVRFLVENLSIDGSPEALEMLQSRQESNSTGDALDDIAGDGGGMDIDLGIW